MAPFIGPGRDEVVKRLRGLFPGRQLPITVGQYAPQGVLRVEGERWVLRHLELDEAAARAAGERALAEGGPWMPEMEFQFLRPGEVFAEADSAKGLAELLERRRWPFGGR